MRTFAIILEVAVKCTPSIMTRLLPNEIKPILANDIRRRDMRNDLKKNIYIYCHFFITSIFHFLTELQVSRTQDIFSCNVYRNGLKELYNFVTSIVTHSFDNVIIT